MKMRYKKILCVFFAVFIGCSSLFANAKYMGSMGSHYDIYSTDDVGFKVLPLHKDTLTEGFKGLPEALVTPFNLNSYNAQDVINSITTYIGGNSPDLLFELTKDTPYVVYTNTPSVNTSTSYLLTTTILYCPAGFEVSKDGGSAVVKGDWCTFGFVTKYDSTNHKYVIPGDSREIYIRSGQYSGSSVSCVLGRVFSTSDAAISKNPSTGTFYKNEGFVDINKDPSESSKPDYKPEGGSDGSPQIPGFEGMEDLKPFPELPENANILDYIVWFFNCIGVLFENICIGMKNLWIGVKDVLGFIGQFFAFIPTPIWVLIILGLTVSVLLMVFGRK